GSQGGWVAPLAATMTPTDFVVVSFGLAVSPLAAERESIEHEVRVRVPGPEGAKVAGEFAAAIEHVASSNFRDGFDQLAAVRQRYGREPWFKEVGGEFARFLLDTPADEVRKAGPPLIAGIKLDYDPMAVLRSLEVPQLWLLGGKDRDAAPYETIRRLTQLRCAGRPITLAVYPNAEHGMYEFEVSPTGERLSTRQPASYFRLMRDFIINGRVLPRQARDATFPGCQ
ncbi:MAG TPA: alpha/beta hydrolase, partial [Sphingomicrobium sp.]|nr:alpha/beta hydrolase [Sphingomicrobium sp.]